MIIKCPYCLTPNPIENPDQYAGKKIRFRCIKQICNQYINHSFEAENDITIISNTIKSAGIGQITLLKDEINKPYTFLLKEGSQTIGRKSANGKASIQIESNDVTMSRLHCEITGIKRTKGEEITYILKDLDSKNKININGKVITADQEIHLQSGDHIQLGQSLLVFEYF